jgi:hypothetical protein
VLRDDDDDDDNNNNKLQTKLCGFGPQANYTYRAIQGQLQTQHSVDMGNYIMDKHNMKSKTNYRQALEETTH